MSPRSGFALLIDVQRNLFFTLAVFTYFAATFANAYSSNAVADDAYWGRFSFVPDWREGNRLDALATTRFLDQHWHQLYPTYKQGRTPANASEAKNTEPTVFFTSFYQAVIPDYYPSNSEKMATSISIDAALGESEAFSIGVRSGSVGTQIELRISDLRSDDHLISADDISQRLVLAYPARSAPKAPAEDTIIRPMVLIKPTPEGWWFPSFTSHNYFVDIHVPVESKAGSYKGTVKVLADKNLVQTISVRVIIHPFRLRTNNFHAGAFGTTYDIWEGGFTGYYPEMVEMDSRYGLNMAGGFFNKGNEIPFKKSTSGALVVDSSHQKFQQFDNTMQRLRAYGMGGVVFWNWGAAGKVRQFNNVLAHAGFPSIDTDAGKRGFAAICKAIKATENQYGWPEIVINPYDEALDDQDATRDIIEASRLVKSVSPETRLYMTEWREHYARLYQSSGSTLSGTGRPRWKEYVMMLALLESPRLNFAIIGSNRAFRDSRKLQDQLGGEYWHYAAVTEFGPWARLAYGFRPYSVSAEAALIWANYKGKLDGSGWTLHYVLPNRIDGRKARDTRGPVLASPRAILAREGIDDRKYIETLRYWATTVDSASDLDYLDELQEKSRGMLQAGEVGGRGNTPGRVVSADVMQSSREEIRNRILVALSKVQRTGNTDSKDM